MSVKDWGRIKAGAAHVAEISDSGVCTATLSDFGARLVGLVCPDRTGRLADIVLGHDSAAEYEKPDSAYVGATCGRYANRIAGGVFHLDGTDHRVDLNEGANHLHGGRAGFDMHLWAMDEVTPASARFTLRSPDGDMGYPGTLTARVTYAFTGTGRLEVTMTAEVEGAPTVVNLVNHAYFNLAGQGSGPIDDQLLTVAADSYLPVGPDLIPTGEVADVTGTAFDFRQPRALGRDVPPAGFDHNLCLSHSSEPQITAQDPVSGRGFRLWTDQPGVQLYTAGHIAEGLAGKAGARLGPRAGFTLETQRWPDSPNRPGFPPARLDPGETYLHRMVLDLFAD